MATITQDRVTDFSQKRKFLLRPHLFGDQVSKGHFFFLYSILELLHIFVIPVAAGLTPFPRLYDHMYLAKAIRYNREISVKFLPQNAVGGIK